jgi:hypothetical protein
MDTHTKSAKVNEFAEFVQASKKVRDWYAQHPNADVDDLPQELRSRLQKAQQAYEDSRRG